MIGSEINPSLVTQPANHWHLNFDSLPGVSYIFKADVYLGPRDARFLSRESATRRSIPRRLSPANDDMTPVLDQTAAASLLGMPVGELVLRVRGTSRDGQLLRLGSSKCTIGSGSYCSLRLRASGVRPLHCVIVRGAGSTVIRRWSPDTLLNGRDFDEATLVAGDTLSLGPIDLEVMATASVEEGGNAPLEMPTESLASSDAQADDSLRQAAAEAAVASALEKTNQERRVLRSHAAGRVRQLVSKLRDQKAEAGQLRDQWQQQVVDLEAAHDAQRLTWQQQRDAWLAEQSEWKQRQEAWQEEREQLLERRESTNQQLVDEQEQLAQQQAELAFELEKLASLRQELDTEREQVTSDALELREHVEAFWKEQSAERSELEQLREQIASERSALDREQDEFAEQLAKQHDSAASLDNERQTELDRQAAALKERQAELEARSEHLVEQTAAFDADQANLETQQKTLIAQQEAFASQQADLQTQSEYLMQRRTELADRELQVARQVDELTRWNAERNAENDTPQGSAAQDINTADNSLTASDAPLAAPPETEMAEVEAAKAEMLDTDTCPAPLEPSVEQSVTETEDNSIANDAAHVEDSTGADNVADSDNADTPAEVDADSTDTAELGEGGNDDESLEEGDEEGDESINEYMRQLLERTRGVSQPESADDESLEDSEDVPEATGVLLSQVIDGEPGSMFAGKGSLGTAYPTTNEPDWDPSQMSPRSSAPEAGTDMDALRDLANQSANSAIDTSMFKRWKAAAACNACLSLICFVAGYLVIENVTDELGNAYLGGAAAFVGSVYWAVQCGTLMKNASWLHSGEKAGGYTTPMDVDEDLDPSNPGEYEGFELS